MAADTTIKKDVSMTDIEVAPLAGAIIDYAGSENDVIRSAAVQAIGALPANDGSVKERLLLALRDEDPAVRVDAAILLDRFLTPDDAPVLLDALRFDPLREVKVKAIEYLAKLGSSVAIPLLMDLAISRLENGVKWEDRTRAWDDWLDIQIAAIDALGVLQAAQAVPVLVAAFEDEFAQDLGAHVFPALACISQQGIDYVLDHARNASPRIRRHALNALRQIDPEHLHAIAAELVEDEVPEIRVLAVPFVSPCSTLARRLCLEDVEPNVRARAVSVLGAENQDLVYQAISDEDERVCAAALDTLSFPIDEQLAEILVLHCTIWMKLSGPRLSASATRTLGAIRPSAVVEAFDEVVGDENRPPETRIATVKCLGLAGCEESIRQLEIALINPDQRVRIAALFGLKHIADGNTERKPRAIALIADAIRGRLIAQKSSEDDASRKSPGETWSEAPKGDFERYPSIRSSHSGRIIENDAPDGPSHGSSKRASMEFFHQGKVAGVGHNPGGLRSASDEKEDVAGLGKRNRRISFEANKQVSPDVRLQAIRVASEFACETIQQAVLGSARDEDDRVREEAFGVMASYGRRKLLPQEAESILLEGLECKSSGIRANAVSALCMIGDHAGRLLPFLADQDPAVRASAVGGCGTADPERAVDLSVDPSSEVRNAAVGALVKKADPGFIFKAIEHCIEAGHADTLGRFLMEAPNLTSDLALRLQEPGLPVRDALILLEALGHHVPKEGIGHARIA